MVGARPVERELAATPARALWGRRVLGPDGERLGYVSATIRTPEGHRLAIVRRGQPRWQRVLVDLMRGWHPSPRAVVIDLENGALTRGDRIRLHEMRRLQLRA